MMKLMKLTLFALLLATFTTTAKADRGMSLILKNVLTNYFEMQKALAANNSALAIEKSQGLIWDLKTLPVNELNDAQHRAWFTHFDKLTRDCRGVSQGNGITDQKASFSNLSADLFDALKTLNASPYAIYKLSADGRYWLGKSPSAKNPYGGKLGNVQAILKAR